MDIDLGSGIDGTQTAALILAERDIPIVFLSSHTAPEVVEKTEKITSYGYVVKNSNIAVLDASIKMAFKLFDAKQVLSAKEEVLPIDVARIPEVDRERNTVRTENNYRTFGGCRHHKPVPANRPRR